MESVRIKGEKRRKKSFALLDVLVTISIISLMIITSSTSVKGVDKVKELIDMRTMKLFEERAIVLKSEGGVLSIDGINKQMPDELKVKGNLTDKLGEFGLPFEVIVYNDDYMEVKARRYTDLNLIEAYSTLKISITNDIIDVSYVNNIDSKVDNEGMQNIPSNREDYYTYSEIPGGYRVELNNEFKNALIEQKSFIDWIPGSSLPNIGSKYNGKPVISSEYIFSEVTTEFLDLSNWDTSEIIYMSGMFYKINIGELRLGGFNTENVLYMDSMFSDSSIESLDISTLELDKVLDLSYMFSDSNIRSIELGNFNSISAEDMSYMFAWSRFENIDMRTVKTCSAVNMKAMFAYCEMESVDLSNFRTEKVENMISMFEGARIKDIDISNFCMDSVNLIESMFSYSTAYTVNIGLQNTVNVSNTYAMFYKMSNIEVIDIKGLNMTNVIESGHMFNYNSAREIIMPILGSSKIEVTNNMFSNTPNLQTIDLSTFDLSNAYYLGDMFYNSYTVSGIARNAEDAIKLNTTSNKPEGLLFVYR